MPAPECTEAAGYLNAPAVRDRGLIVEFAGEIMAELGVLTAADRDLWQRMFRTGRVEGGAA